MGIKKDIAVSRKEISKAGTQLDTIERLIAQGTPIEQIYQQTFEYARTAEKIANVAREIPALTGIRTAKDDIIDVIAEASDVKVEVGEYGPHIIIPCLLPKKEKGNPSFIRNTLHAGIKKYIRDNGNIEKIEEETVLVFNHQYARDHAERNCRDHDNIELNAVIDILALFFLLDDGGLKCRHYYYSSIGDKNCTEIFIVKSKDFINFLSSHDH